MSFWNRILFLEAKRILNWYFHSNLQTRGLIIIFYTKYITSQKKTRTISRKYVHLPLDLQSKYRCESKFVRFNPRWWKKSNQSRLNVGKKDSLQLLYRFSVFVYSVYRSILITMCERRLLLNVRWKYTLEKRFDGQTSVKWHFISAKTHTHICSNQLFNGWLRDGIRAGLSSRCVCVRVYVCCDPGSSLCTIITSNVF